MVREAGDTDDYPCTPVAVGALSMRVTAAVTPTTGIMTAASFIEDSTLDQDT